MTVYSGVLFQRLYQHVGDAGTVSSPFQQQQQQQQQQALFM
jgi:hypothetical protein